MGRAVVPPAPSRQAGGQAVDIRSDRHQDAAGCQARRDAAQFRQGVGKVLDEVQTGDYMENGLGRQRIHSALQDLQPIALPGFRNQLGGWFDPLDPETPFLGQVHEDAAGRAYVQQIFAGRGDSFQAVEDDPEVARAVFRFGPVFIVFQVGIEGGQGIGGRCGIGENEAAIPAAAETPQGAVTVVCNAEIRGGKHAWINGPAPEGAGIR